MPLDNTAKISDIITSLEGMQGINQKAELASVIGAPATGEDNIATQITKIQDAKDIFAEKIGMDNTMPLQQMAESLVIGKKWMSGETAITQTLDTYQFSATAQSVVVTGLTFKPSLIICYTHIPYYDSYWQAIYVSYELAGFSDTVMVSSVLKSISSASTSIYRFGFGTTGYVNETGFKIPVGNFNKYDGIAKWIAFE